MRNGMDDAEKKTEKKTSAGLMTEGNIGKQLLLFCIPLLLGNLFQLLYNTVDSIVVGNYVGSTALAAVGAATPVVNLFIAFFVGLSAGAGVVISRYFGACNAPETSKAVHTFLTFSLALGLCLSVFGVLLASCLLHWIGVPEDVFPLAEAYLQLYFVGNVFVIVYNAGTGILQAVGDARHPLYFLGMASCLNILLDVFFVGVWKWGVEGAAVATLISQAFSMALVLRTLVTTGQIYRIRVRSLGVDWKILWKIICVGVPAGLQQMIVSFSNVIVQSYVNTFGSAAIAGYSSANKFDNFLLLPVNSFGLAAMTFTGQNLGAHRYGRVRKGITAALALSLGTVAVLGAGVFWNAERCVMLFSPEEDVIAAGASLIRIMCPFYGFLCFQQTFTGVLRASRRSIVPMITSVSAFVIYRQIMLALVLPKWHDIRVIGWGFSTSWVLGAFLISSYFFGSHWLRKEEAQSSLS